MRTGWSSKAMLGRGLLHPAPPRLSGCVQLHMHLVIGRSIPWQVWFKSHFREWGSCWQALQDVLATHTPVYRVLAPPWCAYREWGGLLPPHARDTMVSHSCCGGPDPSTRPVETLTHAFLECPVAQAVMMWLSRVMEYMDGTTPPATVDVLLLGRVTAWRPEYRRPQMGVAALACAACTTSSTIVTW